MKFVTENIFLIVIVFVVGGAFAMVALRGEESAQTYSSRSDSDGLNGNGGDGLAAQAVALVESR